MEDRMMGWTDSTMWEDRWKTEQWKVIHEDRRMGWIDGKTEQWELMKTEQWELIAGGENNRVDIWNIVQWDGYIEGS